MLISRLLVSPVLFLRNLLKEGCYLIAFILRMCWGHIDLIHHLCYWVWIDWKIARILHFDLRRINPIIFHPIGFFFFWRRHFHQGLSVYHQMGFLVYSLNGLQTLSFLILFFFHLFFLDRLLLFHTFLIAVIMFAQKYVRVEPNV